MIVIALQIILLVIIVLDRFLLCDGTRLDLSQVLQFPSEEIVRIVSYYYVAG